MALCQILVLAAQQNKILSVIRPLQPGEQHFFQDLLAGKVGKTDASGILFIEVECAQGQLLDYCLQAKAKWCGGILGHAPARVAALESRILPC